MHPVLVPKGFPFRSSLAATPIGDFWRKAIPSLWISLLDARCFPSGRADARPQELMVRWREPDTTAFGGIGCSKRATQQGPMPAVCLLCQPPRVPRAWLLWVLLSCFSSQLFGESHPLGITNGLPYQSLSMIMPSGPWMVLMVSLLLLSFLEALWQVYKYRLLLLSLGPFQESQPPPTKSHPRPDEKGHGRGLGSVGEGLSSG